MRKLEELSKDELISLVTSAQETLANVEVLIREIGADHGKFYAKTEMALKEVKKLCRIGNMDAVEEALDIVIRAAKGRVQAERVTMQ